MGLRFRELPDEQMKHFVDYLNAGKPIIALRTSTHAFKYDLNKQSPYARYDWHSKDWPGGFGQQVLGETWVDHHGNHGKESTRGVINEAFKDNPVLRGVADLWVPTDVYAVTHLPKDAQVLVWGAGAVGHEAERPAGRGRQEPSHDAGGLAARLHGRAGQDIEDFHDDHGRGSGPGERRPAPAAGQRMLLGDRPGEENPGQS